MRRYLYLATVLGLLSVVATVQGADPAGFKTLAIGGVPRRIAFDESGTHAVVSNEAGFVTIIQ